MARRARSELILGANGYLGQYLAWDRKGAECHLHSASAPLGLAAESGLPFTQEDLAVSHECLSALRPNFVYVLARPLTSEGSDLAHFESNLCNLLRDWCESGCLEQVVFASTNLVYAVPSDGHALGPNDPLAPQSPYECHKASMESFLAQLSNQSGIGVDLYRLPLLGGRAPVGRNAAMQLLFRWRNAYRSGCRWRFPDSAEALEWGSSWVHIDDVVQFMSLTRGDGASVRQPVSGHIRYSDLDRWFRSQYPAWLENAELHLPKTSFYLEDNMGTPQRDMERAFDEN